MNRTVVGDTTTEALAAILQSNPRGVLVNRDELAGWVRGMDQYKPGGKGSDRQFWLSAWSNQPVPIDRKSQEPIYLPRPFACIAGSIQPDVLPELQSNREDGMMERFLYAYPEPVLSDWTDDEISATANGAYKNLCDRLGELEMEKDENGDPEPRLIEFSPEAKEVFVDAYNEHAAERRLPGFPRMLKTVWPKLEGYLARLLLILAASRAVSKAEPERVEARDVVHAMALLGYFKKQAFRTYTVLHGEDKDERLLHDLATFLAERDGVFEGTATELDEQFTSRYKPEAVQWLSSKVEKLAEFNPDALTFDRETVAAKKEDGSPTTKRILVISLRGLRK